MQKPVNTSIQIPTPLPRAIPSEAGVPAGAILRFLDRLDHYQVNLHSLLLMRHGSLIAEGYYAPNSPSRLHRMFSVCKTLNALAVGLLAEEGRLRLDDKIVDYFPDKVPADVHPWIREMTIRHMLMMRTCHASTTYKYNIHKEWVESFFTTPPTHKPGTVFHYDTSAAHVLCALAERLSGMPMLDYLKEKALRKIGWSENSYMLKNEFGDSHGGSGLMATSEDLLRLGMLLIQKGSWQGEQLLPASFVEEMTSCLTPNALTSGVISETQGYGYQIWRTRPDGFACYGLGGQLVVCLPKEDLILVTTADTQGCGGGNDFIYNCLYEEILPALDTPLSKEEEARTALLRQRLSSLRMAPVKIRCRALPDGTYNTSFLSAGACGGRINHKIFKLEENPQGFTDLSLSLSEENGVLSYTRNGASCRLSFALERCLPDTFPEYGMYCANSAMWLSPDTFYIKSHLLDTSVGSVQFELVFGEEDVTVFMKKTEETLFQEYAGHFYGRCGKDQ